MGVGGEILSRGNGAEAQSQECTGDGWHSGCLWVGEPGKVGRCQVGRGLGSQTEGSGFSSLCTHRGL